MNQTARLGLRLFIPILVFAILLFGLGKRHGSAPALGRFLQPFHGAWVPPDDELKKLERALYIPGLKGRVTVRMDDARIPHIFAENDEDLYAVQGFITASDRLWQMQFVARVAGGRLSEIFGKRTINFDKMFHKLGLPKSAEKTIEVMESEPATKAALAAYSRGINAYIATLTERTLPFEYKLLEHAPEQWTSLNSALLLKFMAYNLSFWAHDLTLSRSFTRVSESDFFELFPDVPEVEEPIVPRETQWKNIEAQAPARPEKLFHASENQILPYPTPHPGNGSNNWAVASKKSTTGHPIVSNDVHLGYQLPALWYQVQLHSPKQNVFGASMPGAPGIILGFNERVAWAVTNAGTDILDWFELKFRDDNGHEYLHNGSWRPVISVDQVIKVRDSEPVTIVLKHTHFGPIVYENSEVPVNPLIPRGLAMKWGALETSNELASFLSLNRSKDFSSCRDAVETFAYPAQNFICADNDDIGIFHQGQFPLRWFGQGRMISDGTDAAYDWVNGFVPSREVPSSTNPSRGFVSSANQSPVAPGYPHFLGGPYDVPFRGQRINELLSGKAKFTPESMVEMQSDTLIVLARELIPALLKVLPEGKERSTHASEAIEILKKWDFRAEPDRAGATLFDKWSMLLNDEIWNDHFPNSTHYFVPRWNITLRLIKNEPQSKWFDRIETDEVETLALLADRSLEQAVTELKAALGSSVGGWTWGRYQITELPHLGKIPGLGSRKMATRGHRFSIFANNAKHGPTWKSVVAVGPKIRAWGIYPGGQSGNPASKYYDTFIEDWHNGKMREIDFMKNKDAKMRAALKDLVFEAKAGVDENK